MKKKVASPGDTNKNRRRKPRRRHETHNTIAKVLSEPNKWYLHETKLSTLRSHHSTTAITGNQMLIIGGITKKRTGDSRTAELFDFKNNSLIMLPDIVKFRKFHSSVVLNNYLYIIGGVNERSVHRIDLSPKNNNNNSAEKLLSTNRWETDVIPSINEGRQCAAAVVHDEYIYLFGGEDENLVGLSSCLRYRPSSSSNPYPKEKSWEIIASLKIGRSNHTAVNVGNKIYVMGGFDRNVLDSMEIYDPSINKFEDGPSLPIPLESMISVSIGKYIVVTGGRTNNDMNERTFLYDTNQRIWRTINNSPTMNNPRECYAATVFQKDKKIVVCGGYKGNAAGRQLDSIEWIFFDELLHGKRWDRRKEIIIIRYLVERGRASQTTDTIDSKRKNKKKGLQSYCLWHLVRKSDNDVFRSVVAFL